MRKRILFLLKRHNYGEAYANVLSSGLYNSSLITAQQLENFLNVEAEVKICADSNAIDKEVHRFKPDICVLEAIWITPEKLKELKKLHRKVIFIVRIHSEIPFLASEGVAVERIRQFNLMPGIVTIAFNSKRTVDYFNQSSAVASFYLPNVYNFVSTVVPPIRMPDPNAFNIGCFGAIRPLKNQLIQAVAALIFANQNGYTIRFHINSERIEQFGSPTLKNIRSLFYATPHKLVEHSWLPYDKFLKLVGRMELGLQVSFTESFNIIAANFVEKQTPIVVSETIQWMPHQAKTDTLDAFEIACTMKQVFRYRKRNAVRFATSLNHYNTASLAYWERYLEMV